MSNRTTTAAAATPPSSVAMSREPSVPYIPMNERTGSTSLRTNNVAASHSNNGATSTWPGSSDVGQRPQLNGHPHPERPRINVQPADSHDDDDEARPSSSQRPTHEEQQNGAYLIPHPSPPEEDDDDDETNRSTTPPSPKDEHVVTARLLAPTTALILPAASGSQVSTPSIPPLRLNHEPIAPVAPEQALSPDPQLSRPVIFHSDGRPVEIGFCLSDFSNNQNNSGGGGSGGSSNNNNMNRSDNLDSAVRMGPNGQTSSSGNGNGTHVNGDAATNGNSNGAHVNGNIPTDAIENTTNGSVNGHANNGNSHQTDEHMTNGNVNGHAGEDRDAGP